MIEVSGLTKKYGKKYAVDGISFTVNKGEIVGLLGPNGAGKTTTMNMITGYISATAGTAKVGGHDILEEPDVVKSKIGYLPELPPLYLDMTVKDYLYFVFDLKKIGKKGFDKKKHVLEVANVVKITDVIERPIRNLSKGYKQRVGLAQALLGSPDVLILDEPTVGLDPKQIIEIRNLIEKLGKSHTIILSSHILSEVQAVCDRIIVIAKGKKVADAPTEELTANAVSSKDVIARIAGPSVDVMKAVEGLEGVRKISLSSQTGDDEAEYIIETDGTVDIKKPLFKLCADNGWYLLESKAPDMSLEDIFIQLTDRREEK